MKIKELRKKHRITQEDLAKKLGIGKSAISNYESGYRMPKQDLLFKLANIFDVSVDNFFPSNTSDSIFDKDNIILSLINETSSKLTLPRQQKVYDFAQNQFKEQHREDSQMNRSITSLEQFRKKKEEKQQLGSIRYCGSVSAGTGEFLADNHPHEDIELPIEQIPDDADFCLRVNGDSMEPIFHDKDYVFIKRQLEIYSGHIGVVFVNGESFLKRIRFENNNVRLESFNKKYKDIIITENDEFQIVGRVVM
ncbi:helix-turn-helix domain-containing protein [Enterococcus faecium]|uniref:Helix-turn-helix domain-containing protein n=2 Tax=Enterococcus faecium TaxID=1352 RepID=A0A6A8NGA6_ENTFC|nr:helix-turn-helix domain-containing protein [Enterococcus faecium]MTD35029.1 helix-turn-helix domain-containing protein [Enterococcus faecium]